MEPPPPISPNEKPTAAPDNSESTIVVMVSFKITGPKLRNVTQNKTSKSFELYMCAEKGSSERNPYSR